MVETLNVTFVKTNGKKFSLSLPYPKKPVVAEDVKSLAQHILAENVFQFSDGSVLKELAEVTLVSKTEEVIEVEM